MEYLDTTGAAVGQQRILCCICGTSIAPNDANMCVPCIRSRVDITEGIPKQMTIYFCRGCDRYLQPPEHWIACDLESRELLALCLKRLKGLNKVRLIDAGFIWTEPHSKRIKVKVTIQKEAFADTVLQQEFVVEFTVHNQTCDDCHRTAAKDHWNAVVQLRQKVNHKRTFYYLEQLIIKHRAHTKTVNIKECADGLDFYFESRSDAVKLVDFLGSTVPIKMKSSERLISSDVQNSTANFKFTLSVEIMPICKEDAVCLPKKLAKSLGSISQLLICTRVGTNITLMDPQTLQNCELSNNVFWRQPFKALRSHANLSEYIVLDIDLSGQRKGKYALADVEVARACDFGVNDNTYMTKTHIGHLLNVGDSAMGYDLTFINVNDNAFEELDPARVPYVILVKKHYPARRKVNKKRFWKLENLTKIKEDAGEKKKKETNEEMQYELFLRDLEENPELRANVNLYREAGVDENTQTRVTHNEDGEEIEEDFPEVELTELLSALAIEEAAAPQGMSTRHEPLGEDMDMLE
ncbi:hypothetical protein SARC_08579 [Sphaeroforma arctica JP610]|uniref:60S ribosomal export protein NMD3 n=1 Tax=Sphaeroforma arctica JP610 TaxID=667725 RepID=A0A0L0FQG9_9EUKA|nr:hypothetical protein SARC_08579 [Sphaeroforma arctica JP610]KNC79022.1 hypothetical protein SARC_08579 [Sphaeroforma arctica JP610]|eukprot:XP_014152924.1 hypothetical protein SARC_08579 [Sphaeroforma arctica JP610]